MQTADFYSSATGTLRVNGGRDENAPAGVSLSIDDLSYIKQGSRANDGGDSFAPTQAQLDAMNSGITSEGVEQITTNKNNISTVETDTTLLKNTITTIRFASGVSRSWRYTQRTNYHIFMVFGFVQGVGLVYWTCKIDNTGTLKVYDTLANTEVTQSTITYSVADSVGTVTIQSSVAQWSYLTIIKNAEIT